METKPFELDGVKYTLKKFKYGQRNKILDQTTILGETGQIHMLTGTLRHLTTKFGCLKNGKELTDEEIEDLDDQHGAKLFGAIQEFNGQRPLVP